MNVLLRGLFISDVHSTAEWTFQFVIYDSEYLKYPHREFVHSLTHNTTHVVLSRWLEGGIVIDYLNKILILFFVIGERMSRAADPLEDLSTKE